MKRIFFFLSLGVLAFFISYYFSLPKLLRNVKKADQLGIVKEIKNINIQRVENPINASIEEYLDNYIVAFRIDKNEINSIGITFLDKNFEEIGLFKKVDVKSSAAQDARIFKYSNDYFLIYNDKLPIEHNSRAMNLAKLNDKTLTIDYKTILDQHIKIIEKNWTPFIYNNELHFAYSLMPHKILKLNNFQKNDLSHLVFEEGCFSRFFWKWGEPRGGTPAKLVDGNYLSFFHSSFGKKKKSKQYVMGAYIFEPNPPYKVLKVSKFPLIFGNIKKTRVYFPTSFVVKKENNKDMIYLSYGENDKVSKIAVIDKDKLFENMQEVY